MRSFIRKCSLFFGAAFCLVLMTTCNNPLSLGSKVNTEKPIINNPDDGNKPGSYLQGDDNVVYFDVQQEFGISSVYMTYSWTDLDTGDKRSVTVPASLDSSGYYKANIDTLDAYGDGSNVAIPDGNVYAQVTAVDTSGNKTTTTEMVYIVKNLPPQIEMTIPGVKGGTMYNGDGSLNPDYLTKTLPDFDDPDLTSQLDKVYQGFDIMGLAEDNCGIADGFPKIMIWPAPGQAAFGDISTYVDSTTGLPFQQDPTNTYGKWVTLDKPVNVSGLKATKFTYSMSGLPLGNYRFRIWTRDLFGKDNFYPDRADNRRGASGAAVDPGYPEPITMPNSSGLGSNANEIVPTTSPDTLKPRYMQITYTAADIPIIVVGNVDQYYNGQGTFTVTMDIMSSKPLTDVTAYVSDTRTYSGSDFNKAVVLSGDELSGYSGTLTINKSDAASWHFQSGETLYVNLVATDNDAQTSPPTFRSFIWDTDPPDSMVDRPVSLADLSIMADNDLTGGHYQIYYPATLSAPSATSLTAPKWVTGTLTIGGSNEDHTPYIGGVSMPNSGIDKVYFHIGKLGDDNSGADREAIYNNPVNWTDTGLGTRSPAPNWSGSVYSWTYTENFNGYRGTNAGDIQEAGELTGINPSDPKYATDSSIYSSSPIDTVDQRFYLPFYVKVLDGAGNEQILHYTLCIDPKLDDPLVTIDYPKEGAMVGGEVRLTGSATDNNWVHSVQIRVLNGDTHEWYMPPDATPCYGLGSPVPNPPSNGDDAGWFYANKNNDGTSIVWFYNINSDGALNPPSGAIPVSFEVRAVDTKNMVTHAISPESILGPSETLNVQFSSDVPTISTPKITKDGVDDRDYFEGMQTSGKFTVSMLISDASQIKNLKVRAYNNSPPSYTNLITDGAVQGGLPAGWAVTTPAPFGPNTSHPGVRQECTLTITFDTTGPGGLYPYGTTGTLYLDVQVDNDHDPVYTTNGTYKVGVDNFYPSTVINTASNASGDAFVLQGVAKDYGDSSGAIQGVERVLVYFEKTEPDGQIMYLNPRGKEVPIGGDITGLPDTWYSDPVRNSVYTGQGITWGTSMPPLGKYPNVRDMGDVASPISIVGDGPNVPNFAPFPLFQLVKNKPGWGDAWESPHAMVIDAPENGADVDLDGDGTFGEVWGVLVDKEWQARMDTTKFPDGPLMVHYIVMDQAGNATHYKKAIYIENHKPLINDINLGTDVNGDGDVDLWVGDINGEVIDPGEFMRNPFTVGLTTAGNTKISFSPSFRIRNNRFRLMLDTVGGNDEKHYKVSYVTPDSTPISAGSMIRGEVYTIATPGTTDWPMYGALNNTRDTTFVASGPGEGNGLVTKYNYVKSKTGDFGIGNDNYYNIIFDESDFASIPDSPKDANGTITSHDVRLFIIKVFDTTVPGTIPGMLVENDQLAHAVLVEVDIDNTDQEKPKISVAPFGREYVPHTTSDNPVRDELRLNRNVGPDIIDDSSVYDATDNFNYMSNYNKNIVMSGSSRRGYVQYAEHSDPIGNGYADISGKVVFMGTASDNQRISRITAQIPGYNGGAEFDIAKWNNNRLEPANGLGTVDSIPNMAADGASATWGLKVVDDYLTLDYGHVVDWQFAWDSSAVTNMVSNGVAVTFKVYDSAIPVPNFNNPSDPLNPSLLYVNVVPYISGLTTGLSGAYSSIPSAFNRSARGWYPVRESEVITINGFNLYGGTTNVTINNVAATIVNTPATVPPVIPTKNQVSVNVGTTTTSGDLVVTVNGTSSFNNRNYPVGTQQTLHNHVRYNQEPNNLNNNILNDDRKLYLWNTGYLVNNSLIEYPVMRMSNAGKRSMVYGEFAATRGRLRVMTDNTLIGSVANSDTGNAIENTQNRYLNLAIAIDAFGDWFVGASNMTANQENWFNLHAKGVVGSQGSNTTGTNKRRMISLRYNSVDYSNRVRIPRIYARSTNGTSQSSSTNPTRVLVSYWDEAGNNNPLILHYGTVNVSGTDATSASGGIFGGNFPNATGTATQQIVADDSSTTAYHGSMYSAVASLSNGTPVIAWYDKINNKLIFSYGNTPASGNTNISTTPLGTWQANAVVVQNLAGSHVDMAVDPDDNIHLAYYDVMNGGLYYARIPSSGGVPDTRASEIQTAKVDTYLSAGTKLMINIRNNGTTDEPKYVPYISYFHASFGETKNAIRVAWLTPDADEEMSVRDGTNSDDSFTGAWEVMTVPAETVPLSNYFICNGVPTATTWTLPGGTSTLKYNSNMNKTILVSYMTSDWYEGAVLKGNIVDQ